jgi:ribosomal protein S18 acetylase RimI-like enzyme
MEVTVMMGLTIIPMTAEMIPETAKLHATAFSGYMNTQIGNTYVRAFLNWFRQAKNTIALVAIDENAKIIGYVVGAPLGYNRSINRDLLWVAAVGIIVRPWSLFRAHFRNNLITRLRLILKCAPAPRAEPVLPKPTMSLVSIGVSPSDRGKKVGRRLVQAFETRAGELQMQSLRLSVYPDNTAARQLYENCGWQLYSGLAGKKEALYYFRVLDEKPNQGKTRP